MKKTLLGISLVVLLSGCGTDESQLEEMMTIMSEDKVMLEHLSSLSYDISAETDYEDDLPRQYQILLTAFHQKSKTITLII